LWPTAAKQRRRGCGGQQFADELLTQDTRSPPDSAPSYHPSRGGTRHPAPKSVGFWGTTPTVSAGAPRFHFIGGYRSGTFKLVQSGPESLPVTHGKCRLRKLGACAWIALSVISAEVRAGESARHAKPAVAKSLAESLTGEARADYEAGKVLASDGDFAGALIKWESAYEQSKDPRLLWNVAFCDKNMRHYSRVIATLERYLSEGAGYLSAKDRKDAEDLISTIKPFTIDATFTVSEAGAQVFVDDAVVGVTPLTAKVVLDIGERRIRVVKEGYKPFEKNLPVGGSASVVVDVKLEKELHEGRLGVNAPANAVIEVDQKPMGTGKIDVTIGAGGHQLRVTAPGTRPYQTEVVIQDRETRVVEVMLEKLAEPEKPKIRVAVGCDGSEPRGPDDGLVVYLDGPEVLTPANVKKRWSDELGRNVVTYVEYATAPGVHRLRARVPDCESLETPVTVDPVKGADVTGALPSDTPLLFRGPEGAPGHLRLGLDAWLFRPSLKQGGVFQMKDMPESYGGGYGAAAGFALGVGYVSRWFGMFLQTARGTGTLHRASFDSNYALPSDASATAYATTLRLGFRVPFNVVALNLGPEIGMLELDVARVRTGKVQGMLGTWAGLDIQPLCDWGARASFDVAAATDMSMNHGGGPVSSLQFGLFWEPNARCRRERSTEFGLRSGGR